MKFFPRQSFSYHQPDYVLIFTTFALVLFGLVILASASSDIGQIKFNDSYFYLKHQLFYGLGVGILGFWLASKIYYRNYQNWAAILFFISLALLALIFTNLGISSGGARRWIMLGPLSFQPSEILKITFIFYLASWLSAKSARKEKIAAGLLPFSLLLMIVTLLLIFQPSTSAAAILIGTALVIYFAGGAKIQYFGLLLIIGLLAFLAIVYTTPYRWERISSFFHPEDKIQSSSYQLNQALTAIGSGGITGVGFGKSTTKVYYLPQPIDDSIFAIIGEELGFAGVIALITLFLILSLRALILAKKIKDSFGKLLLVGFGSLIVIQAFLHIGSISGLIPLTGVPLPFISYGGTALAVFLTISGIMVNISKYS